MNSNDKTEVSTAALLRTAGERVVKMRGTQPAPSQVHERKVKESWDIKFNRSPGAPSI